MVITTSAVNFGLLFETEQLSIIESFAGLLNSLSFPIQIVVHSRRLDVSSYLQTLDKALTVQTNPLLKNMTIRYREFVAGIIKEKNVLDKQFYVCIMVNPVEMGVLPKNAQDKTKRAITVLSPRRDHLIRQLSRLGLKAKQLTTPDLVKLFYSIYNPINEPALPDETEVQETREATKPAEQQTNTPNPPATQPANIPVAQPPAPQIPRPISPTPPTSTSLSPPFIVEELNDDFGP